MDKYEFNIKVEQIKKLVNKGDYETALKITDTIDWRRVRNTNLLSMVALIYEKNEEYQDAKDILVMAFERAPVSKRLLFKLAEITAREGEVGEAESYYREFCDMAPDDPRQSLLRYLILKAKGAPAQQLIHSLESYTSVELDEKWLYELAELYEEAGMQQECVAICDKIMLMFGLGKYVERAMELKQKYAPLTSYQMDLVENRDKYEAKLKAVEQHFGGGRVLSEDDYDEEESVKTPVRDSIEEDLVAKMRESEAEESLAREMSRIATDTADTDYEDNPAEHTRILHSIKNMQILDPEAVEPGMEAVQERYDPSEPGDETFSTSFRRDSSDNASGEDPLSQEVEYEFGDEEESEEDRDFGLLPKPVQPLRTAQPVQTFAQRYSEAPETELQFEDPFADDDDEIVVEDEEADVPVRNHLMIEARTPEKGLQVAIDALKQIHKETGSQNPVAKINGSKLSRKGVFESAERLAGKDLIVEEAGDLSETALGELNELMNEDDTGMVVVLIDNPKQMESLHQAHPQLASKFECIGCGESTEFDSGTEAVDKEVAGQVDVQEAIARELTAKRPPRAEQDMRPKTQQGKSRYYREDATGEEFEEEQPSAANPDKGRQRPAKSRRSEPEDDRIEEEYNQREPEPKSSKHDDLQEDYEDGEPVIYDDIEEMGIDEFAQFCCKYAAEIDCSVTGKSMLALYERIEIMEEDDIPLTQANAVELIEEAADRAERPSIGKLIAGVFSSKYNKDGLLILKEEHFIH